MVDDVKKFAGSEVFSFDLLTKVSLRIGLGLYLQSSAVIFEQVTQKLKRAGSGWQKR
jgi:hypothetical protein